MKMRDVKSSSIRSVGYEPETKTLGVTFNHGMTYHYANVDQEIYDAMMVADSVGKFFQQEIKNRFKGVKQ